MSSLGLKGPYDLNVETIEQVVKKKLPGNYAIGSKGESGKFSVYYVGRSDSDIASEVKGWVDKTSRSLFKFDYAKSSVEAFKRECENYHDFMPRGNEEHPRRMQSSNWVCPRCLIYG